MVQSRCAGVAILIVGLVILSTPPVGAFQSPPTTEALESAVADLLSPERERRARAERELAAAPEASAGILAARFVTRPPHERYRVVSFLLSPAMGEPGRAAVERLGAAAAPSLVLLAMEIEPQGPDGTLFRGQQDSALFRLMQKQGDATREVLHPLIRSHYFPPSQAKALQLAYELNDPATVALASEAVGDPRPEVRRVAVNVLGRAGGASEVPAILSAAGDRDEDVRKAVHESLVLLGPKAVGPLERALADRAPANVAAAWALCDLGPLGIAALQRARPASIDPLLVVLRRHSSKEVMAAVYAVAAPEAVAHLVAALRDEVRTPPREGGPLAVDLLGQLLEMFPAGTRPPSLAVNDPWPVLFPYLEDRCEPNLFVPAAKVLAVIHEARAIDALASGVRGQDCGPGWSHGNGPVVDAAIKALVMIGGPDAIPPLVEAVEDTDLDVTHRDLAANGLRQMGDPAGVAAAERFLAAPLSKRSVVKRRLAVLAAILVFASVLAALAVRLGSGLVSHRLFLLVCAGTGSFAAWPALNSTPPDFTLIGAALAVLWAIGRAMGYWFERPGSASPFLGAAARALARGVGAALVGILLLIPLEILGFLLYIMNPRHP